jgi:hypothetical protein
MKHKMSSWKSVGILFAMILSSIAVSAELRAQHADLGDEVLLTQLRDDLSMEVSEWLEFESAEIKYSTVWKHRYWVGTFKALKPCKMQLTVKMKEDIPADGDFRIAEFSREFLIAPPETSRIAKASYGRAFQPVPLACVGDKIQIPVRLKVQLDRDHEFETKVEEYVPPIPFKDKWVANSFFTSNTRPQNFELGDDVGAIFDLQESVARQFPNRTETVWYCEFEPILKVKPGVAKNKPLEFNLRTTFQYPNGKFEATSPEPMNGQESVRIVPEGMPVTASANQWQLAYEYRGERTNRGSEALTADVTELRPGDVLKANPGRRPSVIKSDWDSFPILQFKRTNFQVNYPTYSKPTKS